MQTSEMNRRKFLQVAGASSAALALPSVLAACSSSSDASLDKLTWLMPEEPESLSATTANGFDMGITHLGLEPFLTADEKGLPSPLIASDWSQDDPLTYTYRIRDGVEFWDGTPFTIDDAVFSWTLHQDKKFASLISYLTDNVASVKARGSDTLEIKLIKPDAQFEYTPMLICAVSKQFYEKNGDKVGNPDVLNLGTGPYQFDSFKPGGSVDVSRNEAYWGDKPDAGAFSFRFIEDEAGRLLATQSGDVNGSFAVPLSQLGQYKDLSDINVLLAPGAATTFFSFDLDNPPFNDVHVRRAIAHALDRDGAVSAVLNGAGTPAVAVAPVDRMAALLGDSGAEALRKELDAYPFDIEAAKQELAQSATPDGFTTTILFDSAEPEIGKVAQILAENLKQIGINLEVKETGVPAYVVPTWRKHTVPIGIAAFDPDSPDPANIPQYVLDSANALPDGNLNLSDYINPEVDKLFDQYNTATNPDERGRTLSEILKIEGDDVPYVPVYNQEAAAAVDKSLNYDGFSTWWYLQQWTQKITAA